MVLYVMLMITGVEFLDSRFTLLTYAWYRRVEVSWRSTGLNINNKLACLHIISVISNHAKIINVLCYVRIFFVIFFVKEIVLLKINLNVRHVTHNLNSVKCYCRIKIVVSLQIFNFIHHRNDRRNVLKKQAKANTS